VAKVQWLKKRIYPLRLHYEYKNIRISLFVKGEENFVLFFTFASIIWKLGY